jgi:transcriptional regulator with XRE-family HTH domain
MKTTMPNSVPVELLLRVGENLQRIRHEKNLKQYNIAHGLQLNESVVSQVERGCYESLSFKLLNQFAQYYQVSIDEILHA